MKLVSMMIALVVGLFPSHTGQQGPADLAGDWKLVAATTTGSRDGATGEQPTKQFVSDSSAFNCGRECRISYKGSTLTIEGAKLKDGATEASPRVDIVIDGKPHSVVDSVAPGNTIETVARWEGGKLLVTSMLVGRPLPQTVAVPARSGQVIRHLHSDVHIAVRQEVSTSEGTVLLLGDNRSQSVDSRTWGPVPIGEIVSVVLTCPSEPLRTE